LEYAGGYSDMLAQRGSALPQPHQCVEQGGRHQAPCDGAIIRAETEARFREKHALETLPARIAKLSSEIAALRERLSDPGLFARDPAAFNNAVAGFANR